MPHRKALFIRLDPDKHFRISTYARLHDLALTTIVESLVDQLLAVVDPDFSIPEYLAGHFSPASEQN